MDAKLSENFPKIRVLFTSGYSAESDVVPNEAKGRYLQKLYSPRTWARLVRKILNEPAAIETQTGAA
jgi:hypothetical protein